MAVPPTSGEADLAVPAAGTPSRTLTNAFLKDVISTLALKGNITSQAFVTPNLGTPTAGVLTNCTGLPTAGMVDASVTLAKMANLAQDQFIGRTTASTGVPQTATITAAARTVLDDTTVAAMVDTLGGASSVGTGGLVRTAAPSFTGLETHGGTDLFTAAAMGANAIDITKARNTKTLSADTTFTYSATPSDGGEFGLELTGHTAVTTVTLPANTIDGGRQVTITSFVMPANTTAFLYFRRVGSNYYVFGVPTPNIVVFSTANLTPDDTYEGNVIGGLLAGATIAQWEAVYLGGSSTWLLADANGSSTYPCRGLAVAAYSSTNPALVIDKGVVRNDAWAWTPGGDVYLSTTAGGLTQTAPSTSGDKIQKIGYALTADILCVNIGSGEYLTVT